MTHTSPSPQPLRHSRIINVSPVYYGWVVLIVGSIGGILTSPGQTYAIAVFIDSFIEDLGVSRSMVSTLYGTGTLLGSFALPFVGRQIDKRGVRAIVGVVSLLLGVTCVYMGFIQNALMLGVGFFLLRMLGQGSLSLVSRNVINLWWVRRRGVAMGISGVVVALMGGLFPYIINSMIPIYGWRMTYILMGAVLILFMLPIGWIFTRDRPEEHGLQPDGAAESDPEKAERAPLEANWTLAQALRTPTFWLITSSSFVMSMLNTGLAFHLFSIFADSGLSSTVAASIFVPMAATGALMQLASGIAIGRVPAHVLQALGLFLNATILVMAAKLSSAGMAYSFGVVMGVQSGVEMLVISVVYANYFGRRHLGSIGGLAATIGIAGSALGPMPLGIARDLLGSYSTVLIGFAALPLVLGIACVLFCRPPGEPPAEHE